MIAFLVDGMFFEKNYETVPAGDEHMVMKPYSAYLHDEFEPVKNDGVSWPGQETDSSNAASFGL